MRDGSLLIVPNHEPRRYPGIALRGWTLTANEMTGVCIFGQPIPPGSDALVEVDVVVMARREPLGLGLVPEDYSLRLNGLGLLPDSLGYHGSPDDGMPMWRVAGQALELRESVRGMQSIAITVDFCFSNCFIRSGF